MPIRQTLVTDSAQVRVRNRLSNTFGAWAYWNGPWVLTDSYTNKVSVSTPNFRRLKRSQLPPHPHTLDDYVTRNDYVYGSIDFKYNDGTSARNEYRGPAQAFGIDSRLIGDITPSEAAVGKQALNRLFDELSRTAGSAAVTGAELPKTLKMVGDTARRLAKAYGSLRRGKISGFTDALGITITNRRASALRSDFRRQSKTESDLRRFAANTWLEYTYGWKPLISDVYNQCENLANHLVEKQGVVRTGRGSAKEKKLTIRSGSADGGNWKFTDVTNTEMRVSYVVKYKLRGGETSWIDTFGLQNPAIVIWEVIPFSFVVDWFLPIGNFLEQLSATSGLLFHSGTKTVRRTATCEASGMGASPSPTAGLPGTIIRTMQGKGSNHLRQAKSRTLLTDFPSPRWPEFKDPRSLSHAVSGIALLYSAFHGGVPKSARN